YSRVCDICCSEEPRDRSVFIGCGHSICRACAEQIQLAVLPPRRHPYCPFCRKNSKLVTMVEVLLDEEKEKGPKIEEIIDSTEASRDSYAARREKLIQLFLRGELEEETYTTVYDLHLTEEACARGVLGFRPNDVYDEEYRRLLAALPLGSIYRNYAEAAADVVRRREKRALIERLRREDEKKLVYSRVCGRCHSESPRQRCLFK
ncbi:hypothetical protein PENTCL1PPCAC_22307, partial [Pristionchus entomophagus]